MRVDLFDFYLPENLIAKSPTNPRDNARLLVMDKSNSIVKDGHFFDLPFLLRADDVLVFNKSKVIPARLLFNVDGKEIEIFLVKHMRKSLWKCMVRPGKSFKVGTELNLDGVSVRTIKIDEEGLREIDFGMNELAFRKFLSKKGKLPIPPYIKGEEYKESDYNTVFAEKEGSIAAPTAGLHFTNELLSRLSSKGVALEYVTLQVGLGTFLPMKTNHSEYHKMHMESYEVDFATAKRLNDYKEAGRRIIAVGTTSVRVLEDNVSKYGRIVPGRFQTNIFIKPGYKWKMVDGLITNFHLPKSTLLMLVSAFSERKKILKAYELAIRKGYKFYSFGDGMLII